MNAQIPLETSLEQPVEIKKAEGALEMHLCWSIWNTCNYRCSYCPDVNKSASNKWLTKDHVIDIIDQVHEHYARKMGLKKIQVSFTGGEPTLFKGYKDICRHITDHGMTIGLTTNGSVGIGFWKDVGHLFDWLCFSYHPEMVDEKRFFNVLAYLHDRPDIILPAIRLMMHPDKKLWEQCLAFSEKIKESFDNWAIEYVELQTDFGIGLPDFFYDDGEQIAFLKTNSYEELRSREDLIRKPEHPHDEIVRFESGREEQLNTNKLINKKLVNFHGWECDVGLESLFINYGGEIYRAGCREGGVIGMVGQEKPIEFPTEPITCELSNCICGTNIMVSKRR